ncbi:hypothetical protein QFC22_004117 [Naganishia vaughanmartiniae]|uniref:Uncharacterized protein n=1 Tax=Naganishia vaughanmartiniae TaxID=1424756 RepID=A0ACC2X576_9TREE|nr:hypothetical protein QFC22_004117 [Naganishia vaughanmartiniae]
MSKRPGDPAPGTDPKRARPTPSAAMVPPAASGGGGSGLDMAAIRAQIAARMASMSAAAGRPAAGPIAPSPSSPVPTTQAPALSAAGIPSNLPAETAARLAALRERIAAQQNKITSAAANVGGATSGPVFPSSVGLPSRPGSAAAPTTSTTKGGLGSVVAHPLLADLTASNNGSPGGSRGGTPNPGAVSGGWKGGRSGAGGKYAPMVPKFTSVKANARFAGTVGAGAAEETGITSVPRIVQQAPSLNPYLSVSPAPNEATADSAPIPYGETAAAAARRARPTLKFIQKGKYINRAEQLRKDQKLEELRQRIAENARKVGLESEFDILERNVRRQPPPEVEWWDAPLLRNGRYEDLDAPGGVKEGTMIYDEGAGEGEGGNRLVTLAFVQHPIPIPAPWEGKVPQARGLMLTKKEQKKMRRQRRAAELQDKRDRQKMGLLPPDPPKIRLQNMMKVLTSSAISDPTKVEAKVRAEAAGRQRRHEEENEARKLTDEQKREKLEQKKVKEEHKGLVGAAFKIKYLVNGAHRFKIRKNAEQLALNGLLLFHSDFAMVYVEGSAIAMKKYKRLLLSRIDWTEEARPKPLFASAGGGEGMDVDALAGDAAADDGDDATGANGSGQGWQPIQSRPETMADNRCELVWEGEVQEKHFRSFRYRNIEVDREAREMLGKAREGLWDLTKRWIWEGVD